MSGPRAPVLRVEPNLKIGARMLKSIIAAFEQTGKSTHSGLAGTLPFIINHCEEQAIPYRLTAQPGVGYFIERIPVGEL